MCWLVLLGQTGSRAEQGVGVAQIVQASMEFWHPCMACWCAKWALVWTCGSILHLWGEREMQSPVQVEQRGQISRLEQRCLYCATFPRFPGLEPSRRYGFEVGEHDGSSQKLVGGVQRGQKRDVAHFRTLNRDFDALPTVLSSRGLGIRILRPKEPPRAPRGRGR